MGAASCFRMSAQKGDNREKLLVVAIFIEKVNGAEGKAFLLVLRIGIIGRRGKSGWVGLTR